MDKKRVKGGKKGPKWFKQVPTGVKRGPSPMRPNSQTTDGLSSMGQVQLSQISNGLKSHRSTFLCGKNSIGPMFLVPWPKFLWGQIPRGPNSLRPAAVKCGQFSYVAKLPWGQIPKGPKTHGGKVPCGQSPKGQNSHGAKVLWGQSPMGQKTLCPKAPLSRSPWSQSSTAKSPMAQSPIVPKPQGPKAP